MREFDYDPKNQRIQTVQEFLSTLDNLRCDLHALGRIWYFRGDRIDTALRPSIGQDLNYGGRTLVADEDREKKFLNRFKRFGYPHIGQIQSDWEALFLARHYELPTRILDWTANPLVALYFACSPERRDAPDGRVWGILRFPEETHDVNIFDPARGPFSLFPSGTKAFKLIYPVYNSGRITAQKGLFSWHSHPCEPLDTWARVSFGDSELDVARLTSWLIAVADRTALLKELEHLGVNQRSIFPEVQGITKAIWQTEVLWNGS